MDFDTAQHILSGDQWRIDHDANGDLVYGYPLHEDEFGNEWADHGPDTSPPAGGQPYQLTIGYDTLTDLEAALIASAITAFVRRRTPAFDVTVTYTRP